MRTMLSIMKKQKNGIPEDKLRIFDGIVEAYFVPGRGSQEGDVIFTDAIFEHFTQEQRFRLWEQHGNCMDTGHDKERKAFALTCTEMPLPVRLELYIDTFEKGLTGKTRDIVFDEETNTITYTFACNECYNHAPKDKFTKSPLRFYEGCAGGRLYGLQKALGVRLKIKSVDVPSIGVSNENPCVFTFEIVG